MQYKQSQKMTKMRFIFLFSIFISQSQHFFLSFFQQLAYRVDRINTSIYLSWKRINEQLANEYETKLAKEKQNTKKEKISKKAQLAMMNTWHGTLRFIYCTHPLSSAMFYSCDCPLPSHIPYGLSSTYQIEDQ